MYWFDWMTVGIVLGFAVLQAVGAGKAEGFALSLFQAVLVCTAAFAAVQLKQPVAALLRLERWVVLTGLFFVFGVIAWILGLMLFSMAGWSFGSFDAPLAFVFGAVTGWAIAHMVLRIIIEAQGPAGPVALNLPEAPVAAEVYWFRTWHKLMAFLFRTRDSSREMWNVDQHGL